METNSRLNALPPYLFADLDRRKNEALKRGVDVIHLGIGDPDLPTPEPIVDRAAEALRAPSNHRYPATRGGLAMRQAVARWYRRRFGVELDPETEVAALIGSKEGLGHAPAALVDPGQVVLVPEPCYPVYRTASMLAGLKVRELPLTPERGFLPDFDGISKELAYEAKLLFLNYPNNPTGAVADAAFFARAAEWAVRHQVWVAHDAAYCDMAFDSPHPSFLQAPGAKAIGLEFGSLSKTFNMTGWRVGFVAGNAQAVGALVKVKDNFDSGVFGAVQDAAVWALDHGDELAAANRKVYAARRREFVKGLQAAGWQVSATPATFYVWAKTPGNLPSKLCAERLFDETAVLATPGVGFGPSGEGCLRFALTVPEARLEQALRRIARVDWAVKA